MLGSGANKSAIWTNKAKHLYPLCPVKYNTINTAHQGKRFNIAHRMYLWDLKSNSLSMMSEKHEAKLHLTSIKTQTFISKAMFWIIRHVEGHKTTFPHLRIKYIRLTLLFTQMQKTAKHNDFMRSADNECEE